MMTIRGRTFSLSGLVGAIALTVSSIAMPVQASPEGGLEDLQERIVRLCNEAWSGDPGREQQCRNDNIRELQEYVGLINRYPPNSRQYQVLIGCSQQYPEAIVMWMMCANLEMPEEPNFKPFDTGPTPVEALRQYRAAQPGPLSPANPDALPDNIRNLPNYELFPSSGQAVPSFAQPGSAQPLNQPTQIQRGQRPTNFTAPPSALPAPTGAGSAVPQQQQAAPPSSGPVYIPGVPRRN